jgi:serine/threonine protein kinase
MAVSFVRSRRAGINPGDRIADYTIVERIGQGGVAEIYRARQTSLDREVAIKVLSERATIDSDIVSRFERESKIIAKLNHPNIVHVIDRGVDRKQYFFVMDYVDGTDFKAILSRKGFTLDQRIDVVIQVLKALDYAHNNGIIHRDIKPSNILIDSNGNAMVADFGIAQILDKDTVDRTNTNMIMGTLAYMSPEQKLSSRDIDRTADIYSIGVILYEILTDVKPMGHFKRPSELNKSSPSVLDEIVLRCLEQNPRDRFQSAVELKDVLLSALHETTQGSAAKRETVANTMRGFVGNCSFLDTIKETQYGATYLVENRADGKLYIIKKMMRRELGLREARILSKLTHPNFIKIHGAGGDASKCVIVMEYAQGGSLADRLIKPYPADEALAVFRQIASALDFAHKNMLIHGNLRPSNVLFDADGRVRLTDFGLPEHQYPKRRNWYSAPERKLGKSSDIYSAGVILHQLLYGRLPHLDKYSRLIRHSDDPMVDEPIRELISKSLYADVSRRYKSFGEVFKDLDALDGTATFVRESDATVCEESENSIPGRNWERARVAILVGLLIITAGLAAIQLVDLGILPDIFS